MAAHILEQQIALLDSNTGMLGRSPPGHTINVYTQYKHFQSTKYTNDTKYDMLVPHVCIHIPEHEMLWLIDSSSQPALLQLLCHGMHVEPGAELCCNPVTIFISHVGTIMRLKVKSPLCHM